MCAVITGEDKFTIDLLKEVGVVRGLEDEVPSLEDEWRCCCAVYLHT